MFLHCCSDVLEIWWSLFTSVGMNFLKSFPCENWGGSIPLSLYAGPCDSHSQKACSGPLGVLPQRLWVGAKAPAVAGAQPGLGTPRPDGLLDVLWVYEFTMLLRALAPSGWNISQHQGRSLTLLITLPLLQEGDPQVTQQCSSQLLQTFPPEAREVLLSGLLHTEHTCVGACMWWYLRMCTFVYPTELKCSPQTESVAVHL